MLTDLLLMLMEIKCIYITRRSSLQTKINKPKEATEIILPTLRKLYMMDNLIAVLQSLLESNHRAVPGQSDLWPGYVP